MQTVTLKPLSHRGFECIGIFFPKSQLIQEALKKSRVVKYSSTHTCWYAVLSKTNHQKICEVLKDKAVIEQAALFQYLVEKKKRTGEIKTAIVSSEIAIIPKGQVVKKNELAGGKIDPINEHVLKNMLQRLKLKAYSPSTIKTYINEMSQLLQALKNLPADELTPEHLRRYLVYCYEKLKLSENSLHSRINSLKFYYEQVLGREKFFWEIPRPKKQMQLPRFFNQDEIAAIIKAAGNIKHKTMLMLAYASGLRVSEVVAIKSKDIDSKRMCILVRQAKGKKDRIVGLSPVLLVMLREYWKHAKPSSQGYLFEGQNKGEPYSTRSLQMILAEAKKKAGILKPGSVHALRHSFATHLLDKGTDVTLIMKLLGHNDLKTTLRYLHVTNRDLIQIISPLDDLKL